MQLCCCCRCPTGVSVDGGCSNIGISSCKAGVITRLGCGSTVLLPYYVWPIHNSRPMFHLQSTLVYCSETSCATQGTLPDPCKTGAKQLQALTFCASVDAPAKLLSLKRLPHLTQPHLSQQQHVCSGSSTSMATAMSADGPETQCHLQCSLDGKLFM